MFTSLAHRHARVIEQQTPADRAEWECQVEHEQAKWSTAAGRPAHILPSLRHVDIEPAKDEENNPAPGQTRSACAGFAAISKRETGTLDLDLRRQLGSSLAKSALGSSVLRSVIICFCLAPRWILSGVDMPAFHSTPIACGSMVLSFFNCLSFFGLSGEKRHMREIMCPAGLARSTKFNRVNARNHYLPSTSA